MSLTDIRLYANNAKSTTSRAIDPSTTVISVQSGGGALFPTLSSPEEFFLVTLENAREYEICKVTGKSGEDFTVERGQEGSPAKSFPAGTLIQMRVTRAILSEFARLTDRLGDVPSVDGIPSVEKAVGNSYLCQSTDDAGNPIIATKAENSWRFPTHSTIQVSGAISSATETSISAVGVSGLPVVPGRYILNFTSGSLSGTPRLLTGISGSTVSWDSPLDTVPEAGVGYELLVSNAYQLSLVANMIDESIINAIIFGSN